MEQRISIITLGVADVARSQAFYEALGWVPAKSQGPGICFFQMGAIALGLYGRQAMADDALVEDSAPGFSGVSIAWNGRSEAEVDAALDLAVKAGAKLIKPAQKVFWGGYSGYFADPDRHLWEVAYNPFFPLDDAGGITLPR